LSTAPFPNKYHVVLVIYEEKKTENVHFLDKMHRTYARFDLKTQNFSVFYYIIDIYTSRL